jgi:predicted cation transporter
MAVSSGEAEMLKLAFGTIVVIVVLIGPVLFEAIDRNVELFFLVIGLLSAYFLGQLSEGAVRDAVTEPLPFTLAVLTFGSVFRTLRDYFDQLLRRVIRLLDPRILCFGLTIILAFLAAFITPVVSALVFVEGISLLRCDRRSEIGATVFACFAIGFGAGLTPLGLPGIAVVLRSLHVGFWYLAHLLGPFIIAGVFLAAVPILFLPFASGESADLGRDEDSWSLVLLARPGRVYLFIVGLVLLSDAVRPLFDTYIHRIPNGLLFWMNTISAVVNNSTLAAVEIGPSLSLHQQRAAFLGLLVSGGALVTGNIPNIVAASRLGITSREWARVGLGTGAVFLICCFSVLSAMAVF